MFIGAGFGGAAVSVIEVDAGTASFLIRRGRINGSGTWRAASTDLQGGVSCEAAFPVWARPEAYVPVLLHIAWFMVYALARGSPCRPVHRYASDVHTYASSIPPESALWALIGRWCHLGFGWHGFAARTELHHHRRAGSCGGVGCPDD